MCTAITCKCGGHCFGRTLDLERSYGEELVVTPRHFLFPFRRVGNMAAHYALIGIAVVADGLPLYYDAANERGLCMAALNFPGNAHYLPPSEARDRVQEITPFEFIPWILGRCAAVRDARELLRHMRAVDIPFSDAYPLTPLHWILADAAEAVVIEPGADGLAVYDNPAGVMTNSPVFPMQEFYLQLHRGLSAEEKPASFGGEFPFESFSRGIGSLGLPGDFTSPSRFVRAAFVRANTAAGGSEEDRVGAFFHMMDTVSVPRGCVRLEDGKTVITRYTSCWSGNSESYYYTTYHNRRISALSLRRHDLEAAQLYRYPLEDREDVRYIDVPGHT